MANSKTKVNAQYKAILNQYKKKMKEGGKSFTYYHGKNRISVDNLVKEVNQQLKDEGLDTLARSTITKHIPASKKTTAERIARARETRAKRSDKGVSKKKLAEIKETLKDEGFSMKDINQALDVL